MYFVQSRLLPDVFIFHKNDYTDEELAYAQSFKDTFDIKDVLSDTPQFAKDQQKVIENIKERPINDYFIETNHSAVCEMGSTDVGDVSWVFLLHKLILHVIPLVQVHIAGNGLHKVRAVLHIKAACLRVMYCLMPQKHCIKILK
ncbi:hypothetical protein CGK76_10535 [Erysipelotrichaceae bacterium 7770_A6]|nr:hypothetical protein [Erysipelotrichaceae bacterium 7770_A6]